MNNIRRVFVSLLTVLCLFTNICAAMQAEAVQTEEAQAEVAVISNTEAAEVIIGDVLEESINLLTALGMAPLVNKADLNLGGEMTVYEVRGYINRMIGLTGSFNNEPNDSVETFFGALAKVFDTLNYSAMLPANPTQSNYLIVGQKMGLFKGIPTPSDNSITRETFIKLMFNALNAECVELDGRLEYRVLAGKSTMSKHHDVSRKRGIVTGTPDVIEGLSNGKLEIDGVRYDVDILHSANIESLFGMSVYYYIKNTDGDLKIISIGRRDEYNEILEITSEDIESGRTTTSAVYYNNPSGKGVSAFISPEAVIYYNGVREDIGDLTDADFAPADGKLVMIDNNGDGLYDYVMIHSYKSYVVQASALGVIDFKYGTRELPAVPGSSLKNLVVSDDMKLTRSGIKITSDYIGEWDAVKVKLSKDGLKGGLEAFSREVDGEISEYISETLHDYIIIGGIKYQVADIYREIMLESNQYAIQLKNGLTGTFIVDDRDQVVAVKSVSNGDYEYGFLIAVNNVNSLNTNIQMKIYEMYGKLTIRDAAKNVRVNGSRVNSNKEFAAPFMENKAFKPQLIRFLKDASGKVVEVETAVLGAGGTLIENTTAKETYYHSGYDKEKFSLDEYRTGGRWFYNDSKIRVLESATGSRISAVAETPVFFIPYNRSEDSRYSFQLAYDNMHNFSDSNTDVAVYDTIRYDENYPYSRLSVIVIYERPSTGSSNNPFSDQGADDTGHIIVTECKKVMTETGETAWRLKGITFTWDHILYEELFDDVVYNVDVSGSYGFGNKRVEDLKPGDVVRVGYANKFVPSLRINRFICAASADYYTDLDKYGQFNGNNTVIGDVIYVSDDEVIVKMINDSGQTSYRACSIPLSDTRTYNFEVGTQQSYVGSRSQIKKGSRVALFLDDGVRARTAVVVSP